MKFTIDPVWPLPWVLLAIAGLLGVVLWTYPQRVRHLKRWERRLLIGLRTATVVVLAIAMLRPVIYVRKAEDQTRILYILADSSRSMRVPDEAGSSGSNTRRQELLKTLADAKVALKKLADNNVEIRLFDFDSQLRATEKFEDKTDGRQTDVAGALKSLLRQTDGKNVLGVILMGDCAPRVAGADPNVNQRERAIGAARDFGDRNVPISGVPFGGSGATGSAADLAVLNVTVDANPYQGKVVSVNATFRAVGAQGQPLTARILVEDRAGVFPGAAGPMVEARPIRTSKPKMAGIRPDGKEDVFNRELTFVPTRPGQYKIAVEISGLRDERNLANNTVTRIINVRSGGISVAYFDRLRPEQIFIKKVNASDKIQLDFFPIRIGGVGDTRIDPRVFESGDTAYDVYIIGDVPARIFGAENLQLLRKRIDEGAGFLMLAGADSFGAGGYADTPLAEVLPVRLDPRLKQVREEEPDSDLIFDKRPTKMVPTDVGLQRIVMRIARDGKHRELWSKLEPLEQGVYKLTKKPGRVGMGQDLVLELAKTSFGAPLLLVQEAGGKAGKAGKRNQRLARVMAFAGDTTYLWYLGGHQEAYQRFWRQMIFYLAQKEEEEGPVWVKIDRGGKRNFTPADPVPIRFGARDENGNPLGGLAYEIEVLGPPKNEQNTERHGYKFKIDGASDDNVRELKANPVPGEYWIRVTGTTKDGGRTHGTAWERFLVESSDLELDNPAADRKLLESIAEQTGGTFVAKPQEFKAFLDRLAEPQDELFGTDAISLWDTWPRLDERGDRYVPGLLLVFVLLVSVEWFVRKRKGLV
jgi:hypothetical protein